VGQLQFNAEGDPHPPPDRPLRVPRHGHATPTEVTFDLSPSYSLLTARDAHDWFLELMREHEEFEVETDQPSELPVPFSTDTVRRVVVE